MLILTGKNLGERQHQLNTKVNDAAKDKIDFNEVKHQHDKSDVDKLFKIDLASKYKNVEYILEIFKCGDCLYISRALDKCSWLWEKDFEHVINSDYLSNNIFPLTSIKMRNKILITAATYLKDDDGRAISFYTYCIKTKLYNIALKFLLHTPESFKLGVILKKSKDFDLITEKEGNYLEYFIGDSFSLANNFIKSIDNKRQKGTAVYSLRHLYSVSNDKYLDLLESCDIVKVFGRRLSRHIIHNDKVRVMNKPLLYANVLNKEIIKRNSTIEDAKIFAIALLPEEPSQFFRSNYYANNKFVLDLIPAEEKFSFIKKIFTEEYPNKAFETCHEFYSNSFYDMMTKQEREAWALSNIASQDEILGSDNDYLWYKFVSFERAFGDIKIKIMKTTNNSKRCEMLKVLIDSTENEEELTELLNYYNDRHTNELENLKDSFLYKLVNDHKVWRFGEDCWMALEKMFYSLQVFDKSQQNCRSDYRVLTLMYYVLNGKAVPEVFNEYIDMDVICFHTMRCYDRKLKPEADMIYRYILQFYVEKIKALSNMPYEGGTKRNIRRYLTSALNLAQQYEKTKTDLPEIMHIYIKLDWNQFKHHRVLADDNKFSLNDIMNYVKEDAELVVEYFPKIKSFIESNCGYINWLVLKLKIYFSHDISEKYLTLFNECLSDDSLDHTTADMAVRGILTLANETSKIELIEKYSPNDKKIDYSKMPRNVILIQKAICRQMSCSRPPLPLSNVLKFVVGDYVHYCLALFRSYLLNLPYPQCHEFVESIIDKPISIQKHGLRLAFECFDEEKLKKLIFETWKKTKNLSLRMIMYEKLFVRVFKENEEEQLKIFEVLIQLTSTLKEDDDEALFQHLHTRNLPDHLVGRYIESAWNNISNFPDKLKKFQRMVKIIEHIQLRGVNLFSEDFITKIIDQHVNDMLDEGQILNPEFKQGLSDLIEAKWNLTISYLVYVDNEKKLEKNLKLVKHIIKKCVDKWNDRDEKDNKYVIRHFFKGFIEDIVSKSYNRDKESHSHFCIILESIEQNLKECLPEKEIYMLVWNLRSNITAKKVLLKSKLLSETVLDDEQVSTEVKKCGILLGKEFGMLIKTFVDEGKFYWMFYEHIKNVVSTMACNFYYECIRRPGTNLIFWMNDVYILFCLGLLEYQIPETYMLALKLIPTENENSKYLDVYLNVVGRIQAYKNTELQYYFYEKFVNTDFEIRKYIQTNISK